MSAAVEGVLLRDWQGHKPSLGKGQEAVVEEGKARSSQEAEQMFGTEVELESSPGMCENMMNVSAAQHH